MELEWQAGKLFEIYDELYDKSIKLQPCLRLSCRGSLTKRRRSRLTDRFELIICGAEHANAYPSSTILLTRGALAAQMELGVRARRPWSTITTSSAHLKGGMPPAAALAMASTA